MALILILSGLLPFAAGSIQNGYMLAHPDSLPPYAPIAFCALLIWGCIAFSLHKRGRRTAQTVICLHLIAALDLLLIGIQECILHAFWMNAVGSWSQLFYLPVLHFGFRLTPWSHSLFPAYAASFLLMVGIALIGCKLKERIK